MNIINAASEDNSPLAPFTRDQLKADIGTVLLTVARLARFVLSRAEGNTDLVLQQLFGRSHQDHGFELGVPEFDWASSGLSYEQVASTGLAESLETLYDLAFLGHVDTDVADLDSESTPSWLSRILVDLDQSHFVAEWDEYSKCRDSIQRCLQVVETAQARMVLEGLAESDRFMDWHYPNSPGLTFRQMSLLSGMTEPSLRTLAGNKRKNPLKTQSDGRNAYIAPEDAKAWLISKQRYVPIKHTSRDGRHDPTARRFHSADDLLVTLDRRLRFMLAEPGADALLKRLKALNISVVQGGAGACLSLDEAMLDNAELISGLGEALALPGPLLALRAAEVRALERVRSIELQIQRFKA